MRGVILTLLLAGSLSALQPASYDQALDLYSHTDYPAAIAVLKTLPQNARTLELLGRAYLQNAEYKRATEALEKAVALEPENSMLYTWLGRAYGRRAETSFAVNAIGPATKARVAFEKAVQLNPHNGEALDDLFDFYLQAPGIMGGGFDKARDLIPMIGHIDPAQAHYSRARLLEQKKEYDKAEGQLRRAMQMAPNQISRILELARFLSRQGRTDEADRLYSQAVHIAPNAPRLLYARAEMWIQSNRNIDQARDLLKKYIASGNLTPEDPSKHEALKLLKKADGM